MDGNFIDEWSPRLVEKPPIYGWGYPSIGCHIHRFPFDPWMKAFDPWMGISAVGVHHIRKANRKLFPTTVFPSVENLRDTLNGFFRQSALSPTWHGSAAVNTSHYGDRWRLSGILLLLAESRALSTSSSCSYIEVYSYFINQGVTKFVMVQTLKMPRKTRSCAYIQLT